jgi:hypothetical protein
LLAQRAVHTRSARIVVVAPVLAAVVVSGLWLLASRQPTYDPYAWLIWGRQIGEGTLDTVAGPSWKPLPVVLTTPFSWLGDDAAPLLWLVVARTGFLLAISYAYRVAAQIAGPVAGLLAAVGVALVDGFASLSARGNSEGMLVAFSLAAVDRHRAGRSGQALALGFLASLLRPEIWPFFGVYALWWAFVEARPAARRRRPLTVALLGVAVLALWFVPEKIGSGSFLRGASRAREPVAGSPGQAAHPIVATFTNAAGAVDPVFYVGGVIAVVLALVAWRRRRSGSDDATVLVLALVGTTYMVIVAILAQAGFTGNERYVSLPASLVCVLGGVGLTELVRLAADRSGRLRAPAALVGLVVLGFSVVPAIALADDLDYTVRQGRLYNRLETMIQRAGGPAAVRSCGPVYTGPLETQIVAWKLHLHAVQVGIHPRPPGTILAVTGTVHRGAADFPIRDVRGGWVRRATCPG